MSEHEYKPIVIKNSSPKQKMWYGIAMTISLIVVLVILGFSLRATFTQNQFNFSSPRLQELQEELGEISSDIKEGTAEYKEEIQEAVAPVAEEIQKVVEDIEEKEQVTETVVDRLVEDLKE